MSRSRVLMLLAVCLLLSRSAAGAASVTLEPLKDNTICESAVAVLSNGAGQHLFAGRNGGGDIRRGLLEFDVAGSVPAGSTIDSVQLRLFMSRSVAGVNSVQLQRVTSEWGEGLSDAVDEEGQCIAAAAGDATWEHTSFATDFWAVMGGDFSGVTAATADVGGIGTYVWGSTAAMVGDVQAWLEDPASNHGWALLGDEAFSGTAKRFDSRQNPLLGQRPALEVQFTPPPPSVTIFPASGKLAATTVFDLTLVAEINELAITGASASLDGTDITDVIVTCIFGSLVGDGRTLRCPGLGSAILGVGSHTFEITLQLEDGSSVSDSATWQILTSTEP